MDWTPEPHLLLTTPFLCLHGRRINVGLEGQCYYRVALTCYLWKTCVCISIPPCADGIGRLCIVSYYMTGIGNLTGPVSRL